MTPFRPQFDCPITFNLVTVPQEPINSCLHSTRISAVELLNFPTKKRSQRVHTKWFWPVWPIASRPVPPRSPPISKIDSWTESIKGLKGNTEITWHFFCCHRTNGRTTGKDVWPVPPERCVYISTIIGGQEAFRKKKESLQETSWWTGIVREPCVTYSRGSRVGATQTHVGFDFPAHVSNSSLFWKSHRCLTGERNIHNRARATMHHREISARATTNSAWSSSRTMNQQGDWCLSGGRKRTICSRWDLPSTWLKRAATFDDVPSVRFCAYRKATSNF